MTNEIENQSPNQTNYQQNNKYIDPAKIIESLGQLQTALTLASSHLQKLFEQMNIDAQRLKKLQDKLKAEKVLWRFDHLEYNMQTILTLAGMFDKPQYVQFKDSVIEIRKPKDEVIKTLQ
jgi:hypothetical protein